MRMNQTSIDLKYLALGQLSPLLFIGKQDPFENLKCFCCFVGHGRSGGTLVGSLLNAHPNVVISNELHAFRLIRKGLNQKQLFRLIYLSSERQVARGSKGGGGYTYAVPGQAQGSHDNLIVIGARKAGATAREIFEFPDVLKKVDKKISLNKKFIHVSRHPLDCITTTFKKTPRGKLKSSREHLQREIGLYFRRCESVERIVNEFESSSLLIVHLEELIESPTIELRSICEFLGLDCSNEYLEAAATIIMGKPNVSRRTIEWDQDLIDEVRNNMSRFPWLECYLER